MTSPPLTVTDTLQHFTFTLQVTSWEPIILVVPSTNQVPRGQKPKCEIWHFWLYLKNLNKPRAVPSTCIHDVFSNANSPDETGIVPLAQVRGWINDERVGPADRVSLYVLILNNKHKSGRKLNYVVGRLHGSPRSWCHLKWLYCTRCCMNAHRWTLTCW